MMRAALLCLAGGWLLAVVFGCTPSRATRPYVEPPTALEPTLIPYSENEAFDQVFEAALVNQDPVIVIQTESTRPEWGPHLNAWIAAWNKGGRGAPPPERRRVRMQAFSPVVVNGESIREFRLLVETLMRGAEDSARQGSRWWSEDRTLSKRVGLLMPYNLRFHMNAQGQIQLIFFHGNNWQQYPEFLRNLASAEEESDAWSREFTCSMCRQQHGKQP